MSPAAVIMSTSTWSSPSGTRGRAPVRLHGCRGDRREPRRPDREGSRDPRGGDGLEQGGAGGRFLPSDRPADAEGRIACRRGDRGRPVCSLEGEPIGFYIIYHDITELEQTRRRLEERVDERWPSSSGRRARAFLPNQVAEGLLGGAPRGGAVPPPPDHGAVRRHVGFTDLSESLEPEERRGLERVPPGDDCGGAGARGVARQLHRGWRHGRIRAQERRKPNRPGRPSKPRWRCGPVPPAGLVVARRGIPADPDIRVGLNTAHCTVGVFGSEVMRATRRWDSGSMSRLASRPQPTPDRSSAGSDVRAGQGPC